MTYVLFSICLDGICSSALHYKNFTVLDAVLVLGFLSMVVYQFSRPLTAQEQKRKEKLNQR